VLLGNVADPLASCFRRSSVSGGMGSLTTLPSLSGVKPRSEARIAFSIFGIVDGSHGWMTMRLGSGVDRVAIWLSGVGVP